MQLATVQLLHSRLHMLRGIKCNVSKGRWPGAGAPVSLRDGAARPLPQVDAAGRNTIEQILKLLGRRGGV